ncbi:MAG: hypothetical protein QM679_01365 [Patulibacter sp.]
MHHLLRARLHQTLALGFTAAAGVLLLPAGASAASLAAETIPITAFQAGPVAAYNDNTAYSGFPLTSTSSGFAANTLDTGCSYATAPATLGAPLDTSGEMNVALSTQAGASTDYCVAFRLDPGDAVYGNDLNNTLVQLPVGTQGDIDNAAKCTTEQFAREAVTVNSCPAASQVGTALSQLQYYDGSFHTVDAPGRIYALTTPASQAALLGVALLGKVGTTTIESKYLITVSQLGDPAVGLQNQTDTLARLLAGQAPIAIKANALRFWGKAADHKHLTNAFAQSAITQPAADFMRVGTTCQTDQTVKLTVNPYTDVNTAATSTEASTTYKLTGCDALPFAPTFSASLSGETGAGGHPQLDVEITSRAGDEDLGGTKITLPAGVSTDLTRIQNACAQATFQAGNCPDSATIGSAKATLSGIDADVISGDVVMIKVDGKQLPGIGLNFKGRLPLRVYGVSEVDSSGRLVSTFSDLPSLPERSLHITLAGGSTGILQMDPTGKCTASAYDATLTGQNGTTKTFSTSTSCAEQFSATLSNSSKTRPVLLIGSAAPTGKKVKSVRIGLPKGLRFDATNLRKTKKNTYAASGFDAGFDTTKTKASKVGARGKWTFTGSGSNGFSVLTHTGVLRATSAFAGSSAQAYVQFRVVYSDGSKVTKYVALTRAG